MLHKLSFATMTEHLYMSKIFHQNEFVLQKQKLCLDAIDPPWNIYNYHEENKSPNIFWN